MKKEVDYKVIDRTLIIKLNNELDHHNAESIRKRADNIIDVEVIKNVIFDYEDVSFMDSSGVGVIMGRYKRIRFNKGKIIVVNVDKNIDRILRMSGLYRIVEKSDSVKSAIEYLNNN